MPTAPDNHDAHDYAERIRDRLPRRLQELREACGLSMYALWMKCGVSREMSSRIESSESIPTLHVAARLAHGVEKALTAFVEPKDDVVGGKSSHGANSVVVRAFVPRCAYAWLRLRNCFGVSPISLRKRWAKVLALQNP
jgi:transcriptional regulator with XRE-family HTH domain